MGQPNPPLDPPPVINHSVRTTTGDSLPPPSDALSPQRSALIVQTGYNIEALLKNGGLKHKVQILKKERDDLQCRIPYHEGKVSGFEFIVGIMTGNSETG
ncbi:hypothetical protein ABW20_dc0102637 [Dactylellina cionopaga]|nr:hypothetical protein ABW20_dc0102637 [Dactylellina cionopaga]